MRIKIFLVIFFSLFFLVVSGASSGTLAESDKKVFVMSKGDLFSHFIDRLARELPKNQIKELKRISFEELPSTHHTLGLEIRNKYIYSKDGDSIREYFKNKGITIPDEMSRITIEELWKKVNSKKSK